MFERYTYLGYTLIFCLPPLVLLWTRAEFARAMRRDLRAIMLATAAITLYGCLTWPLAIHWKCWSYDDSRILNVKLFDYVYLEDAIWWLLVSFLVASFTSLSSQWEKAGRDIVLSEAAALLRAFRAAFAGFRAAGLERNMAIHVSCATGVLLAACLFRLPRAEWLLVMLASAAVLAAEFLNCAVERLAPDERSERTRLVKDAAASAVLVCALAAAVIGCAVFGPRIAAALS